MIEAEARFEREAVILFAGHAALKRALRGSAPGWKKRRSRDDLKAHHEAGHVVAALRLGWFVHHVSIVPDPVDHSGGHACLDSQPFDKEYIYAPSRERSISDIARAARAAYLLTPVEHRDCKWKVILATARRLRAEAERLVDLHWLEIAAIANELTRRSILSQEQIAHTLGNGSRGAVSDACPWATVQPSREKRV